MEFRNISIRYIMDEAIRTEGIIVDVRDANRFLMGHIPMAVNVPLSDIEAGYINLPKSKWLILYCDNGGASAMAARRLTGYGYRVTNTIGGIKAYNGALTKPGRR